MRFAIGASEIKKRKKNIGFGLLFSLILAAVVAIQNYRQPLQYSNLLLWSVIGFVFLANAVNYYRHRRYLQKIKTHWIEPARGKFQFWSEGKVTELDPKNIAALRFFRKKGELQHIQIRLKNNRGIRLEGYEELEELGRLLMEAVPREHIMDG